MGEGKDHDEDEDWGCTKETESWRNDAQWGAEEWMKWDVEQNQQQEQQHLQHDEYVDKCEEDWANGGQDIAKEKFIPERKDKRGKGKGNTRTKDKVGDFEKDKGK